ncbi:unnamed protein product, partial [Staurois parvus]
RSASRSCALGTRLSAERPHYRSRVDSARLDRGTGKIKVQIRGSHLLYYVRSLRSSPVLCPQSLVISCTVSAVSGHLLYCVRNLWSSPVLCLQSLFISSTMSAVSGHLLYLLCLQSISSEFFFFLNFFFSASKT